MISALFLVVLCASCLAAPISDDYSYSLAVGGGSGTSYSTEGEGHITAIRVWEVRGSYIAGFQLRYGYIWSPRIGRTYGIVNEMTLFDEERIVQVSGKYHSNYIYQLIFVTSRGRFMTVGQPIQASFNHYPTHPDAELKLLSGRYNSAGITSLGAHWGVIRNETST